MSTWCKVSIWELVAITIVLVIIKLTGFGAILLPGKALVGTALDAGWDGWESIEGTGDMREVLVHEFSLSCQSHLKACLPPLPLSS